MSDREMNDELDVIVWALFFWPVTLLFLLIEEVCK